MKTMPKIGVALFDSGSPFSKEGNYACEYRGKPFEFKSASDLAGQTLWITNCYRGDLYQAGLHKNPKMAHDAYYRTKISQMVAELGIKELPVEQQAALLAEVLGNASEMARYQLQHSQHPVHGLYQVVGKLHGSMEAPEGTPVQIVAEQSVQRYTTCQRERILENAEYFSFWFPRHDYAKAMLNTPLPRDGNLTTVPSHRLPSMGRDAIQLVEWALEHKLPLFAKIKIHALEPTIGGLLNYGAGASNIRTGRAESRNMREWCALPELEAISNAGTVEILGVAVADGWRRAGLTPYSSRASAVSYAYGLVAENLWYGLTRKPTPADAVSRTLSTAWLQSVDRMRCLHVAERLHGLGIDVSNYGNGRITVACPQTSKPLIAQIAREEDLLYPGSLSGLQPIAPQPNNASHVVQHLLTTKDYARVVQMDQATLAEMRAAHGA